VFTIGSEGRENERAFEEMKTILNGSGPGELVWAAYRYEDEDHGSVVMRSHYDALKKVFADWRLPVGTDGTFAGTMADVTKHYEGLSARMGYAVRPPEQTVNLLGYQRLGQKRVAEALTFFRYNVEAYPKSANVYDSLGEGLEANGELERALDMYEKAVARGEEAKDPLLQAFKDHREKAKVRLAGKS
jgi:tetratricopeptide (TPR) repeat protein